MRYRERYKNFEQSYRKDILIAICASLLIFILVFRFWPVDFIDDYIYQDVEPAEDVIEFEDAVVVEQPTSVPPPPSPRTPEPRPEEEIVEEEFDFEDEFDMEELPDPERVGEGDTGDEYVAENPSRPPNVRRIVEPSVSDVIGGQNVRIYVSFLVNRDGNVEEVYIDEIQVFDDDEDDYVTTDHTDSDLIEATMKAAYRWQFRPAEEGGELVKARTRHVFTFGN